MLRQKGNATQGMHSLKEFVLRTMLNLLLLVILETATFQKHQ